MALSAVATLAHRLHELSDLDADHDDPDADQLSHGDVAGLLRGPRPGPIRADVTGPGPHQDDRGTHDRGIHDGAPALRGLATRLRDARRDIRAGLVYRHRSSGASWGRPDRVLLARGDIQVLGSGRAVMAGPFLTVMRGIERMLEALSSHDGALDRDPPTLEPEDLPPGLQDRCGPTAGCHMAYGLGGVAEDEIVRARIRGRAMGPEPWAAATRQECLAVGGQAHVTAARDGWLDEVIALMAYLDLDARLIAGGVSGSWSLRSAFERICGLNIRVVTAVEGTMIPIMTITDHLDRFGKAFGYGARTGTPAFAATWCVDIEPFAYALMARFGPAPRTWPYAIRSVLGL
ncbi:MAG: hypothetical protein ACFB6R_12215 [Alphaproteobacteria bacterium]